MSNEDFVEAVQRLKDGTYYSSETDATQYEIEILRKQVDDMRIIIMLLLRKP